MEGPRGEEWTADAEKVARYLNRADEFPHRAEGEGVLLEHVPRDVRRVLDLGTGDGRLLSLLQADRPGMRGGGLYFSTLMLAQARERFGEDQRVEFLRHDLAEPLPDSGRFDAVVSSMAIHHLEHERKRSLYGEVFEQLEPGGVFANFEHVASPTQRLHLAFFAAIDEPIENEDPSDRLLDVETQLGWLREVGFADVDCYWKWLEMALLFGVKPTSGGLGKIGTMKEDEPMKREDFYASPFGAIYSAYMERPLLRRLIGRTVWGGDSKPYYESMGSIAEVPEGGLIVDCPCGAGPALRALRPGAAVRYIAADLSPSMIRRTRRRARSRELGDVEFAQADATDLPIPTASADLFLSYWGLHCFEDPAAAITEAARVLKPGGRLVGSCFVRGTEGLRQRLLVRPGSGDFGQVGTRREVEGWLAHAGFSPLSMSSSGPMLFFDARLPKEGQLHHDGDVVPVTGVRPID